MESSQVDSPDHQAGGARWAGRVEDATTLADIRREDRGGMLGPGHKRTQRHWVGCDIVHRGSSLDQRSSDRILSFVAEVRANSARELADQNGPTIARSF